MDDAEGLDNTDAGGDQPIQPEVRLSITLSSGLTQEVAWIYDTDQDDTLLKLASKMFGCDGQEISPVFDIIREA